MRVLIADDSALIRTIVKEMLASFPDIIIAGEASNGSDAVERACAAHADIVVMDLDMPVMNGLEATARLRERSSIPVLVFTHNLDPGLPFKAMEAGASDFLLKPDFEDLGKEEYVSSFVAKLREISRPRGGRQKIARLEYPEAVHRLARPELVVMGASTGGPLAIKEILASIKAPFPVPVAIVQHIETGFDSGFAEWLRSETGHDVSIVSQLGSDIGPGRVFVSPTDIHLRVRDKKLILDDGPKILNQKPAVDALFTSAASRLLSVLLTGMGNDGAVGSVAVKREGGFSIVQDEGSSLIYGMPKAAFLAGGASIVLPLKDIARFIVRAVEAAP
jgi:two-component system, chemotaxis family, protein-glutamate methylesterase/glutaminase